MSCQRSKEVTVDLEKDHFGTWRELYGRPFLSAADSGQGYLPLHREEKRQCKPCPRGESFSFSILKLLSPRLGFREALKQNNVFSVNTGLSGCQFSRLVFETKVGFGPGRSTVQNTSQHKPWQRVRVMFALQTTSLVLRKKYIAHPPRIKDWKQHTLVS